jgi:hypothetical protein
MFFKRSLLAAFFVMSSVSVVSAYTVVMRDGRRVEIPNEFAVTNSTLTYDVGNDIQITIQLNAVDVVSTERINGESQGSLLQRATAPEAPVVRTPQTRRAGAGRSITNADLEKYRSARVENEKRREELGMPSLEDRQREVAAIDERTVEQVRSMRAQEEAYLRSRADALRAEMAINEARFGSWPQRSEEIPLSYSWGGFPAFSSFDGVGFGITGGRFNRFRGFSSSPFSGFLSTPITPFPTFQSTPVFGHRGRPLVFGTRGVNTNSRPVHMRHGSRR